MVITPIHKKGDRLDPQNYRAIALLSIPGKIFLRILMERMKDKVETKLKETQYGFRAGRGTIDAIFIVRQIIEKAKEKKICLNFHFIDFKSAFDTVWRKALWRMLRSIGINQKYINIIEKMYEKTECSVIIDKNLTEWFRVKVGVRQGCILSPTFFNIFLEFVMDELSCLQNSLELDNTLSTDIRYADDTTFISTMFEKLQISTRELETACRKWGLKINSQKCKVMSRDDRNIYVENSIVEKVDKFVFLGSVVPGSSDDIQRRIGLASSAFGRLKNKIWSNKNLPNKLKTRLYYALIIPIAIYACETWTIKKEDERKLSVFENNCLRSTLRKTLMDKTKLTKIRKELVVTKTILEMVNKRRLNWFGHVLRRGEDSYAYQCYKKSFEGKRPKGRPPKRWTDHIGEDTGLPLLTAERMTADRKKWSDFVVKKCARIHSGLCN